MVNLNAELSDSDLIERLRRLGATWFSNRDLLILEELIRRFQQAKKEKPDV